MRREDPITAKTVKQEVIIETPMGPKVFTYGNNFYSSGDTLRGDYRSQEVSGDNPERVLKDIAKIEAEFQTKKQRDEKRKAVAQAPEEAVLYIPGGVEAVRRGYSYSEVKRKFALEEVQVRGVDLRSGNALITRADGSREQTRWSVLLRPLSPEDRAEVIAANRRLREAAEEEQRTRGSSPGEVLAGLGIVLEVHLDPETFERYADYEGTIYRGADQRRVVSQVYAAALAQAGYHYGLSESEPQRLSEMAMGNHWSSRVDVYTSCWQTEAEVLAHLEAQQRHAEADSLMKNVLEEYAFDKTLVMVPEDEPEKPEDQVSVPAVQAPTEAPDWED